MSEPSPQRAEVSASDLSARLNARLQLVMEVGRASLTKLDMGELLNTVAQSIHRHFAYYDVTIFLVDYDAQECILVAQSGALRAESIRGYRQKLSVGIVGWVAQNGKAVLCNDVRKDPRFFLGFKGEENLLSELAVPIRLHDRTVGVINVERREVNTFDENDLTALETLAGQVAQAIANAQLFEQTRLLLELNSSIVQALPSGLCVLDASRHVVFASPIFCQMVGCDSRSAKGLAVGDVLPAALLADAGLEKGIGSVLERGEAMAWQDASLRGPSGDRRLNIRITPARMPEGNGVLLVLEDVTELRRAAALAEERRGLLDLIVSHVSVAVISFDLEAKFTFWGTGAERLFGYGRDELLGKATPFDFFGPNFKELLDRCRAAGSVEAESTLRRKDGGVVPVLIVLGKLFDRAGAHVGYSAVVLDITERRKSAEALLREKQKLEHVVAVIGAGLALIDKNRRIVWANRTIEEWFGGGKSVEGKICHEIYCRRGQPCKNCPADQCFASGLNCEVEVALARSDGAMRQFHHAVTPVLGPDGKVDHILKLTLDVTEQSKKVYQLSRLRQLSEMMQGVLDLDRLLHLVLTCVTAGQALGFNRAILLLVDKNRNVIEGCMGVGPGSGEEAGRIWSQITRDSPTLEDLLARYDRDRLTRESPMDRAARRISIPLEDRGHIIVACALGRKPIIVEDAARDPRVRDDLRQLLGSRQFVMAPLISRNEPVGVILADNIYSGQPITLEHVELLSMFANQAGTAIANAENYDEMQREKGHLEEAYRDLGEAQDRLVRSERLVAIGRMATHVAHEIRNPLVTVGGFANALVQHPDAPREVVARHAAIIADEVRRLETILARVMDFTRPPQPALSQVELMPIIRDTLEQLQERIARQRIVVTTDIPDPSVQLFLDRDQMKQVFLNLFQNALDVMREEGRLTVTVGEEPERVVVTVANTGEPIRPEDVPKLFEPFFSTKPGGTGLGLAVTQKIVQDHGGDIRCVSSLERGTEFLISLPRRSRA